LRLPPERFGPQHHFARAPKPAQKQPSQEPGPQQTAAFAYS
jgi:hypothetical protein